MLTWTWGLIFFHIFNYLIQKSYTIRSFNDFMLRNFPIYTDVVFTWTWFVTMLFLLFFKISPQPKVSFSFYSFLKFSCLMVLDSKIFFDDGILLDSSFLNYWQSVMNFVYFSDGQSSDRLHKNRIVYIYQANIILESKEKNKKVEIKN